MSVVVARLGIGFGDDEHCSSAVADSSYLKLVGNVLVFGDHPPHY